MPLSRKKVVLVSRPCFGGNSFVQNLQIKLNLVSRLRFKRLRTFFREIQRERETIERAEKERERERKRRKREQARNKKKGREREKKEKREYEKA